MDELGLAGAIERTNWGWGLIGLYSVGINVVFWIVRELCETICIVTRQIMLVKRENENETYPGQIRIKLYIEMARPITTLTAHTITQGPNGRSHAFHSVVSGLVGLLVCDAMTDKAMIDTICRGYQRLGQYIFVICTPTCPMPSSNLQQSVKMCFLLNVPREPWPVSPHNERSGWNPW